MNKNILFGALIAAVSVLATLLFTKNDPLPDTAKESAAKAKVAPAEQSKSSVRLEKPSFEKSSKSATFSQEFADGAITSTIHTMDSEESANFLESHMKKQKEQRAKKTELKIKELVNKLGLGADQEEVLREYMAKKNDILSNFGNLGNSSVGGGTFSGEDFGALLKKDDLANHLTPHLTDEQNQLFAEHQQNELDNKVDTAALNQIAQLQSGVTLNPEQREALYEQFASDAMEQETNQTPQDRLISEIASSFGGDGVQISASGGSQESSIDKKIDNVRGILDETQLEQYRNQLENQSANSGTSASFGSAGIGIMSVEQIEN